MARKGLGHVADNIICQPRDLQLILNCSLVPAICKAMHSDNWNSYNGCEVKFSKQKKEETPVSYQRYTHQSYNLNLGKRKLTMQGWTKTGPVPIRRLNHTTKYGQKRLPSDKSWWSRLNSTNTLQDWMNWWITHTTGHSLLILILHNAQASKITILDCSTCRSDNVWAEQLPTGFYLHQFTMHAASCCPAWFSS